MTIEEQIAALKDAIGKGARVLQRGDERVEYRSHNDMVKALNLLEAQKSGSVGGAGIRAATPGFDRGL